MDRISAIRGMNDILPGESQRWQHVESAARDIFDRYGYREIRTPIVEPTQLFQRSIGEVTDIVEKEMYTFPDRKGKLLTLRPEGTASVVRAILQSNLLQEERSPRLYYSGPMFRYERPQKGRYRQFYQIGAEAFGVADASLDAEIIAMLCRLMAELGLSGLGVRLNSLGDGLCRPRYREALVKTVDAHRDELCADCQRRYHVNPLRVLDCKKPGCQAIAATLPAMYEYLCEACEAHLAEVESSLRALSIDFHLDHRLVRGLDYYTRTAFEIVASAGGLGAQNTVVGGGRYDTLVEQLGGPKTPAIGFALGIERLVLLLGELADAPVAARVFVAALGDAGRDWALRFAEDLRARGAGADLEYGSRSLKAQLRRADRLDARLVVIAGEDELARDVVVLKDMRASAQSEIPVSDALERVLAALRGAGG